MREHEPKPTIDLWETINYWAWVVQKDKAIMEAKGKVMSQMLEALEKLPSEASNEEFARVAREFSNKIKEIWDTATKQGKEY